MNFFSEIVDFKTGYFAGVPIAYSYSNTQDAKDEIGESLRDEAHNAISVLLHEIICTMLIWKQQNMQVFVGILEDYYI